MTDQKFDELIALVRRIGSPHVDESGGAIVWSNGWEGRLKGHYQSARAEAKKHAKCEKDLLDRHKVAALMMIAIVRAVPFDNCQPHISPRFYHARFRLACVAGIAIFRHWIRADINAKQDSSQKEMLREHHFPEAMNGDGSYLEQTVRGLYQANAANRLDPFLVANILFMIDAYHRAVWRPVASH